MKWIEVEPEQHDWIKQWNLTAYYGEHTVGSMALGDDGDYLAIINGSVDYIETHDFEDAKKEFYEILDNYLSGEIDYYNELRSMLEELS